MLKRLTIRKIIFFTLIISYQPAFVYADAFINIDNEKTTASTKADETSETNPSNMTDVSKKAVKAEVCRFTSSNYRKKIAATFFPLQNPRNVDVFDYYDFEKGIGREFIQRLSSSGDFLVRHAEHINLYPDINAAPYIQETDTFNGTSILASIENQFDVQYVISGVIRDLSYEIEKNMLKTFLGIQQKPQKRNLVIDFYLHDSLSEELIRQARYSESIDNYFHYQQATPESDDTSGQNDKSNPFITTIVKPDHAVAFGSKEFSNSGYGKLFDKVLQQEIDAIRKELACRPYSIRVLEQKNKNIYLNAGSNSRIKAGDILTMYHADIEGKNFDSNSYRKQFGWPKSTLKIIQVFPAYSIAISNEEQVVHLDKNREYIIVW